MGSLPGSRFFPRSRCDKAIGCLSRTCRGSPSLRTRRIEKHEVDQRCGLMLVSHARSPEIRKLRKPASGKLHKISYLQFRTKIAQSRALENLAERERNYGLQRGLAVQRIIRKEAPNLGFLRAMAGRENMPRNKDWRRERDWNPTFSICNQLILLIFYLRAVRGSIQFLGALHSTRSERP